MAIYRRGGVYWYEFSFKGKRIRESTETGDQNVARQIEGAERTKLAKGESGIDTGLRVGETLKLEWSMVKIANDPRMVTVRKEHAKNGKARTVPLTPRVSKLLAALTKSSRKGLVFRKTTGLRSTTPGSISSTLRCARPSATRTSSSYTASGILSDPFRRDRRRCVYY